MSKPVVERQLPRKIAIGVALFAAYKVFRRLTAARKVFAQEKYPVSDFIEWRDPNCKDFIHSDMLLADFHRDQSLLEIFRRWLASLASKFSLDLAYFMVPEMKAEPWFKYKHAKVDPAFLEQLREEGKRKFASNGNRTRLFFTGATGFIGHEFLFQVATDQAFEEVVCLIWDKEMAGRTSDQFREFLLGRLPIDRSNYGKFKFIPGDVSKDRFGLAPGEYGYIAKNVTHILHCAASVSFEEPYEKSFYANVVGAQNACIFAEKIQSYPDSKFVSLVLIETCYIHGRQPGRCPEDHLEFPNGYFNNYYEVSKAFASIEGERRLADGLRLTQLCPAIVVGRSTDGVNHGDLKVCNAPVNAFGRIHMEDLVALSGQMTLTDRIKEWCASYVVRHYPADLASSLDLVNVDRVVAGMRAALTRPEAIGHRVQLATHPDEQASTPMIAKVLGEEIGVTISFVNPVMHRWVWDPVIAGCLHMVQMGAAIPAIRRLTQIFAAYSEWGQPRHEVGKDISLLGLGPRPNIEKSLILVARHNEFVQEFGKVKGDLCFKRERVWETFMAGLKTKYAVESLADIPANVFRKEAAAYTESVKAYAPPPKTKIPPLQPPSKL